jgi:hypothetical protein
VLVDTSVWSLALGRARPVSAPIFEELAELVREDRTVIIGPVRQELLAGLKGSQPLQTLGDHLRAFPDLDLETADFEKAAHSFNRCRSKRIQGSNSHFLMCAAASRRDLSIFTTDGDFREFGRVLPLTFHEPRW